MAMQIGPPQASYIAIVVGAVIPQQQNGILKDIVIRILNPEIVVLLRKVRARKVLVPFRVIIREDHVGRFRLITV